VHCGYVTTVYITGATHMHQISIKAEKTTDSSAVPMTNASIITDAACKK